MTTATALPVSDKAVSSIVYIPTPDGRVGGIVRYASGLVAALKSGFPAEQIRKPETPLTHTFPDGTMVDFGKIARIEEKKVTDNKPGISGVFLYVEERNRSVSIPLAISILEIARVIDDLNKDGSMIVSRVAQDGDRPATITLAHLPTNVARPAFGRQTAEAT